MAATTLTILTHLAPGIDEPLFEQVAAVLARSVGRDPRLLVDSTSSGPRQGAPEPFSAGEVDVGFVCSTSYVWMRELEPSPVRLLGAGWVPLDDRARGRPVFFTDIVVDPAGAAEDIEELAGSRVAFNDESSLSGYYAPKLELARRGLDPDRHWRAVVTGGHHQSIAALLEGSVEAAAIDSLVLWNASRKDPRVAALRTIARVGPFPVQPAVTRADLPEAERTVMADALLTQDDRLAGVLAASGLRGFAPVTPTDYDTLATDLAELAHRRRESARQPPDRVMRDEAG